MSEFKKIIDLPNFELLVKQVPGDGAIYINPQGKLNEDVQLTPTAGSIITSLETPLKNIYFDLSGINSINSVGIREWFLFLNQLQEGASLTFLKVSEIFIELAAFNAGILGNPDAKIIEFELPFYCQACETRDIVYINKDDLILENKKFVGPPNNCSKCGKPQDLDALEDEFFAFLDR